MADLSGLKRQRGACKARLTGLESYVASYRESGDPLETLQTKIEFVQNAWAQFEKVQTKIEELDENDNKRAEIEDRYCQIIGRARALINSVQRPPGNAANQNQNGEENGANNTGIKVELPTMNLPVFDGNPEKWLEFRDSFQGLIDANRELTNIQRMYYLRSSVKGRAADVLQSLETSADNYLIAWNLLTKRFEDKRAIAARHLQLLFDIPGMQRESGIQSRQTLDTFLRHTRALELLKANTWDTVINHLMISKFDLATRREWRSYIKDKEAVTITSLTEFLEERCSIIEPETTKSSSGNSQSNNRSENKSIPSQRRAESSTAFASTSNDTRPNRKCAFCGDDNHAMYACGSFRELTVPQRISAVNERKLCRNCFRPNHFADNCQSSSCKKCNVRHNTLLHPSEPNENARPSSRSTVHENESDDGRPEQHVTSVNCSSVKMAVPPKVLLSTARVWIYNASNIAHECRVLLDSGSQSNFLTKEFCTRLKLTTQPFNCSVASMTSSMSLSETANMVIQSKHTAYQAKVRFLITERIIEELPISRIDIDHLPIPTNIKLADEGFNVPGKIDAILGAGLFWGLLCIGQIKMGRSQPVLQKTQLGWIVSGDIVANKQQSISFCGFSAETRLREQIEKFWRIEEVDQKIAVAKDDEWCENHFLRTHSRDERGRFTVSLPFKGDPSELGESRKGALHRLYRLEKKLEREPEVKDKYVEFLKEYIERTYKKSSKIQPPCLLTADELARASNTIIKIVQAESFPRELNDLQKAQRVDHNSKLITLRPFLDTDGIIRVGGRLLNAPVPYSRRCPAVLPSDHCVTILIIRDAHYRSLHAGVNALLSDLQERFWILTAKSTIKRVLHKCIVCFRSQRAFLNVGIDYGGPFTLKLSRNKTCKAYLCLFVCMSTKAVHLELVSDLSTAAFLNSLKRFIARRGRCSNIYSDNGSNFKGAARELRDLHKFVAQNSHYETIDRFCCLWEAGIKSVKTHLRKILSEASLTFEEMYTVLVQIEAMLNSRPLTPISSDPTDLEALTPGHFLIGSPLQSIPDRNFTESPANRVNRFQYLAKLSQHFWSRWSTEYLSTMQQRFKWNREDRASSVEVGSMILLRDEQTPPMQWALGRLIECHPGSDGRTRVGSVKTMKGITKRAVAKICILPVDTK